MYFKYRKIKLYYEVYGDKGKNVIILPGWGDNRGSFNLMIKILQNNNKVFIFDYPSFGKSNNIDTEMSIYDYALMIDSFIIKNSVDDPIIIGHSFGGRIAILLNGWLKSNYKCILIDSAGIKRFRFKNYLYKFLKFGKFFVKNRDRYLEKLRDKFSSCDYKNVSGKMKKTFSNIVNENLVKYLNNITSDTLIIWGSNDLDTPLKDGELIKKKIKDSFLIVIKNAGHFCYLDNSYLVNKIVLEFVTNC